MKRGIITLAKDEIAELVNIVSSVSYPSLSSRIVSAQDQLQLREEEAEVLLDLCGIPVENETIVRKRSRSTVQQFWLDYEQMIR